MPWRLISFLVVLTLVVLFAGFNISNDSDISFGFYTVKQVPVFISLFIAFLVGAFIMLPFAVRKRNTKGTPQKGRETRQNAEEQSTPALPLDSVEPAGSQPPSPKKKRTKK